MAIYRNPPELIGTESTREDVTLRLSEQIRESHCNKLPETQLPAMLAVQQQRDRSMATVLLDAPRPALLIAGAYHRSKKQKKASVSRSLSISLIPEKELFLSSISRFSCTSAWQYRSSGRSCCG